MQTTLTIDDDVLAAAKAKAESQQRELGEIVSDLMREALAAEAAPTMRNGIPLLPTLSARKNAKPVTLEIVNKLRDETY